MSTVNIKSKEYELKFTFNSFKYMEDFNIGDVGDIEKKPFKIIGILETLLFGAVNHDPKYIVKIHDVQYYLEQFVNNDGDIVTLFEELMTLLQESSFFKSLQKK